jgi:hypothetical protein
MGANLDAVRAAVAQAKIIAGEFHTAIATFYEDENETPVLVTVGRMKKPKPSSFDAGNQTEWSTKRIVILKVPQDATTGIIRRGLICQLSTPDGDPTINQINFVVQSALNSQFSAEREVTLATEINEAPRIT